ncbi:hypothetical protein BGW80DRAFT_1261399 [Lactifluus volemus]|nr:hypothetical protein BGW80DRAFT_1261399 [Lactifluus volemus]
MSPMTSIFQISEKVTKGVYARYTKVGASAKGYFMVCPRKEQDPRSCRQRIPFLSLFHANQIKKHDVARLLQSHLMQTTDDTYRSCTLRNTTVTRAYRNGSFLPPSPRVGPPAQADALNGLQQIEGGSANSYLKMERFPSATKNAMRVTCCIGAET